MASRSSRTGGGETGAAQPPPERVGEWLLARRLGRGAMGEVWLGRHAVSGVQGAIKLVRGQGAARERLRGFFAREARAVARLRHPHIAAVFEIGEEFLVTAYIEGGDLARRLQSPMDPQRAVAVTRQIAAALAHAHAHGVVHRDVKPSNILLDQQQNAYLVDFGLAVLEEEVAAGADVAVRAGTPAYMAPEQARGEPPQPAADQYALARTLLEMLLGKRPPASSREALSLLPEALPAGLWRALVRATDENPGWRFPDIAAFSEALGGIDLSGVAAPEQLAPEVRLRTPFAWCAAAAGVEALAPDLARADYKLSALPAQGLLREARARQALEQAGVTDVAWSVYGCTARLGPLTDPAAFARAAEIVVLMHGWVVDRSVWQNVAAAICRDNAMALVLAPDLFGFGESRFERRPTVEQLHPSQIPRLVLHWLETLSLRDFPTVLVGQSMSAVGLVSIGDEELGPRISRVAINPIWPTFDPRYRKKLRVGQLLDYSTSWIKPLRPWMAKKWVDSNPANLTLAPPVRAMMQREYVRMAPFFTARAIAAWVQAAPAAAEALRRLVVMINLNDPLVPGEVSRRAIEALRLSPEQVHLLATGGHYPHLEDEAHPEWTARNTAEIVHLVNTMLLTAREGTLLPTEVASTMAGSTTDDVGAGSTERDGSSTDRDPSTATRTGGGGS